MILFIAFFYSFSSLNAAPGLQLFKCTSNRSGRKVLAHPGQGTRAFVL